MYNSALKPDELGRKANLKGKTIRTQTELLILSRTKQRLENLVTIKCGTVFSSMQAYLNAMRSQWWWLNQLLVAFRQHVRNAEMYQQVWFALYHYDLFILRCP